MCASCLSWDRHYELELDSLVKDGSETENWFGEQAMKKIVKWLKSHTDLVPKVCAFYQ